MNLNRLWVSRILTTGTLFIALSSLALAQARRPRAVRFEPNIQLGGVPSTDSGVEQEEPTIAVNPANPANLVAAFHEFYETQNFDLPCGFANSVDGGRTWTWRGLAPRISSGDFCSDPALAADSRGTFYLSYLNVARKQNNDSGIVVAKSTDGGQTFSSFSVSFVETATRFADKEYIAADASPLSPFRDTLYLSWTLLEGDNSGFSTSRIVVQVSKDGGQSWSNPAPISPAVFFDELMTGSVPVVDAGGAVYIFYLHANPITQRSSIDFAKSTDGGLTWSAPAAAAANLPTPGWLFDYNNGDPSLGFGFRGSSLPSAAITSDGKIFLVWADFPNGSCDPLTFICVNSDVRMSVSADGGTSWSAPVRITDDTGATDQFFPWVAAHPDGLVSVVWLDRRLDPGNVLYDLFYTNTADGRRFLRNVRVSTQSSDPTGKGFIGDYNNVATTLEGVFTVWGDMRFPPRVNVFTASGRLSAR